VGWWQRRKARAAARAKWEWAVDNAPAGMPLLCGRIYGEDVPLGELRQHMLTGCRPRKDGGPCCIDLVRR
jgi:hypothetical protein